MKLFFIILLFPGWLYAQHSPSSSDVLTQKMRTSPKRAEASYSGFIHYSPLDLQIPKKLGFSLSYSPNSKKYWEIEILRGDVPVPIFIDDIGTMKNMRISLSRRSFVNKSLNVYYGLSYFDYQLHLDADLLSRLTSGSSVANIDTLYIQSFGLHIGVGNRWHISKNVIWGFDWIGWHQPLINIKNESVFLDYATNQVDRDNVESTKKLLSYFPYLILLKFQIGITF